jgi:CCR4-NOT transcription complex subunit 9
MITEVLDPETRESALLELSKRRETYEDLALVLWGGYGEYEPHAKQWRD